MNAKTLISNLSDHAINFLKLRYRDAVEWHFEKAVLEKLAEQQLDLENTYANSIIGLNSPLPYKRYTNGDHLICAEVQLPVGAKIRSITAAKCDEKNWLVNHFSIGGLRLLQYGGSAINLSSFLQEANKVLPYVNAKVTSDLVVKAQLMCVAPFRPALSPTLLNTLLQSAPPYRSVSTKAKKTTRTIITEDEYHRFIRELRAAVTDPGVIFHGFNINYYGEEGLCTISNRVMSDTTFSASLTRNRLEKLLEE